MIKGSILDFFLTFPLISEGLLSREPGWNMALALCSDELLKCPVPEIRKKQHGEPPNKPLHSSTLRIMSSKNTPAPYVVQRNATLAQ